MPTSREQTCSRCSGTRFDPGWCDILVAVNATIFALLFSAVPVDFDTQVLPVLAKAGCNTGACHGAAAGRGGFKLSLFGGDPAADYRQIARELEGRRINLAQPERSLLLLKPTWQLDHEGGERFAAESPQASVLLDWIRAGAERKPTRTLTGIDVVPWQPTVEKLPAEFALQVTARFDDGTARDVTELAIYTPSDSAATTVDGHGHVQVHRPGRHAIVVRFLTQVQAMQLTAPFAHPPLDLAAATRNNWIDDEINATLASLRLPATPRADDATLLRRLTLDLTGRLPTPERVRSYLADERPNKFDEEIERLLAAPDFGEYWTYKLARWLRIRIGPNDAKGAQAYFAWLRKQIDARRPLDQIIAELIISDGPTHHNGPANFHRSAADARGEAEHVAETLLGVRLRCANCHNHPLDRWTQDDYHGLAAIFARLDRGEIVRVKDSGEVIHPATGEPAQQRIPGERFLPQAGDGRGELARWIIRKGDPRLATAWVNRLWQSLLGRGLVEPVDDLRDTNPATHPALLDRLAHDFADQGYDLRNTLRLIVSSTAYQRSVSAARDSQPGDAFYAHALRRPLAPEVLLDAIRDATALPIRYPANVVYRATGNQSGESRMLLAGTRAIELYSPQLAYATLGPLAPCAATSQDCPAEVNAAISLDELTAQLFWINGQIINGQLADPKNALLTFAEGIERMIEDCYLRTLSRLPTAAERRFWQAELSGDELSGEQRQQKCQDFAWALLSSREFVTNH